MKSFKQIMAEVAEPIPDEEKKFKAQHKVEIKPHPVAKETQHKAVKPKAKRRADQEGDANYDLAYESVQIDEISKTKMGQYIKRAHADKDTQTKRAGIFDKKGMDADKDKDMYGAWDKANKARKKADNRTKFISKAVDRLTKEAADVASPDESSMAMKQAEFIAYVGREMGEHLKAGKEFPEWMQNKLSKLQQAAQDLHSNFGSHGGDEDVNEAKGKKVLSAKDIKHALQSVKAQPKDKVTLKKAPWDKNEEVNEVTQSAVKKPVNVTGPDGKVRTVLRKKAQRQDDHGQDVMGARVESVGYIDEAVKEGNMKLRDGSSIKVTKEDAKLLNQMFKDLNSQNRKQMEKVMMTDKNGFNEIVGFAREAL